MTQPTLPGVEVAASPEPITIVLEVRCTPVGQPRLKSRVIMGKRGKNAGRAFAHHYTPDTADAFKGAIQLAATRYRNRLHDGPIRVDVAAFFSRIEKKLIKRRGLVEIRHVPAGGPTGPVPMTNKPDRDNLDKVVLDALTELKLWTDDAQVYDGRLSKYWAPEGSPAGVRITITLEPRPSWRKGAKRRKGA